MNFIRFDNKIEAYDVAIVFMSKLDFKNFPKSSNPKISKIKKKSLKSPKFRKSLKSLKKYVKYIKIYKKINKKLPKLQNPPIYLTI